MCRLLELTFQFLSYHISHTNNSIWMLFAVSSFPTKPPDLPRRSRRYENVYGIINIRTLWHAFGVFVTFVVWVKVASSFIRRDWREIISGFMLLLLQARKGMWMLFLRLIELSWRKVLKEVIKFLGRKKNKKERFVVC